MLVLFVILIALVVLVMYVGSRLAARVVGRVVTDRHEIARFIVETGEIPAAWQPPHRSERRLRSRAIRRLSALQRYFRQAAVFEDEKARIALLGRLQCAEEQWKTADFSLITSERHR